MQRILKYTRCSPWYKRNVREGISSSCFCVRSSSFLHVLQISSNSVHARRRKDAYTCVCVCVCARARKLSLSLSLTHTHTHTHSTLIVGLIYLQRLRDLDTDGSQTILTSYTFQRLVLTAVMLASKFLDEPHCTNKQVYFYSRTLIAPV